MIDYPRRYMLDGATWKYLSPCLQSKTHEFSTGFQANIKEKLTFCHIKKNTSLGMLLYLWFFLLWRHHRTNSFAIDPSFGEPESKQMPNH